MNKEELLFLKSKHLNFSDEDLEWVLTHLLISKEDLDKKSIYVKRFIHEEILPSYCLSEDEYDDACEALIKLNNFERVHDALSLGSKFNQCKYFQLTKRFPDVYYELCQSFDFRDVNDAGYDMESMAVQNFCKYAYKYRVFGYLSNLYLLLVRKFGVNLNSDSTDYCFNDCDLSKCCNAEFDASRFCTAHMKIWNLSKCNNAEFDASRFEASVSFMMKEQSMRVRHDKEVLALRSKEKETCSKYKETVAYVQAKAVENQLLVDERNALHTQLLNSGASHKRFKANVSAYISKKNGLIRDLQTQFSELASKTESRLLEFESKVPLTYGGFSVLESKNKELTEQLLACTAAKGVSDTQLEECKAEKEDLTEQLAHTQSLLLQSITSIGKRKRSVFDASQ